MKSRTRILLLVVLAVFIGVAVFWLISAVRRAAMRKTESSSAILKQPAPATVSAPPTAPAPLPESPASKPPRHAVPRVKQVPEVALPAPRREPQSHATVRSPATARPARPMHPATAPEAPERIAPAQPASQSAEQAYERMRQSQEQSFAQSYQRQQKAFAAPPPPPVALSPAPPPPPEPAPPAPPEPAPPPPPEPPAVAMAAPVTVAPLESRESNGIVDMRVFYATDRNSTGNGVKGASFGPTQSSDGKLTYGSLIVSIPPNHVTGELESPLLHLRFLENPAKHIVLESVTPESESAFFADLHSTVAGAPRKDVLIFIHGFDTTFEDAARRTAQLSYDLQFAGAPILYSWPSRGLPTPGSYDADAKNAKWTAEHLMQFLMDVQAKSGATSMHVIAHSMGSRALLDALDKLRDPKAMHLGEVVLAAPDLPTARFIKDVPKLQGVAGRITLYASSRDEALELSQHFNRKPRAGESASLSIVPPAETIDATAVDTGFLGHSYFGDSVLVLKDMVYLIRDGLPAAKRSHLRQSFLGPNAYWIFFP